MPLAERSGMSFMFVIGSTSLLFAGIFFAVVVGAEDFDYPVFEYLTYAFFASGLLFLLIMALGLRGKVVAGEMDGFDVFLALRDGAMHSITPGVLANIIGGAIYLFFFTDTSTAWEPLTYFFLGFGTFFVLLMVGAAIAFENSAIRAARSAGVSS